MSRGRAKGVDLGDGGGLWWAVVRNGGGISESGRGEAIGWREWFERQRFERQQSFGWRG